MPPVATAPRAAASVFSGLLVGRSLYSRLKVFLEPRGSLQEETGPCSPQGCWWPSSTVSSPVHCAHVREKPLLCGVEVFVEPLEPSLEGTAVPLFPRSLTLFLLPCLHPLARWGLFSDGGCLLPVVPGLQRFRSPVRVSV